MTTTVTYVDAVPAALGDLPEAEREELLEDVVTSVQESGETDGQLAERLGPPERTHNVRHPNAGFPNAVVLIDPAQR